MVVQRLTFESPDARVRKTQRDLLVQGALAAQNAVKNKAPLELPQPPVSAPPTAQAGLGAGMGADPLAALLSGAGGGAALAGPPPTGAMSPPSMGMMGAGAPPVPAFATGGTMGVEPLPQPGMGAAPAAPPTAAALGAAGPITGEAEPRIDLPMEAPQPSVQTSPEPYELDPGIVTADRLIDILIRAQQGDDPNVLVTEASRPRTRLPRQNPRLAEQMDAERAPIIEPPGSFLRWLAATRPEDTDGIGKELVGIYAENPDAAADLWGIVQSGLTSEERDLLPGDLIRALKDSGKAVAGNAKLSLPKPQTSRASRSTRY